MDALLLKLAMQTAALMDAVQGVDPSTPMLAGDAWLDVRQTLLRVEDVFEERILDPDPGEVEIEEEVFA